MLAQGQDINSTDKFRARRLSRTNSKPNPVNDLDFSGEPDRKRVKIEEAATTSTKSEDGLLPALPGESVPDGTGSWGDVCNEVFLYILEDVRLILNLYFFLF